MGVEEQAPAAAEPERPAARVAGVFLLAIAVLVAIALGGGWLRPGSVPAGSGGAFGTASESGPPGAASGVAQLRPLSSMPESERMPAASPVANRVVYVIDGADGEVIALQDLADGTPQTLVEIDDGSIYWPTFSPDGTRLVYVVLSGSSCEVQTLELGTPELGASEPETLLPCPDGRYIWQAVWSRDGEHLFLTANPASRNALSKVYQQHLVTGEERQLTNPQANGVRPRPCKRRTSPVDPGRSHERPGIGGWVVLEP